MKYWFFPSNREVFDMVNCLHNVDEIDQPCMSKVAVGDEVFIYVAAPYGQVLYRMSITALFQSFEEVNQGRWAKYAGHNIAPRQGMWMRLKFVDYANPGHKPLQPAGLRVNDIKTSARIYQLSSAKADYLISEFATSK